MRRITNPPSGDASRDHPTSLAVLDQRVSECRACPRLVAWREEVARTKRAAFRDEEYWGRPVPGFGPPDARIVIIGLAPAAHGGNRTGRMFTGDRSGDVLHTALHAVGLASQPTSTHRGDGLTLRDVRITAPVHCAPPANKPTPIERDTCRHWLVNELRLLEPNPRVIIALGGFGWRALLPALTALGWPIPTPAPRFGHGAVVEIPVADRVVTLLGCYHVSQQNTFTGRLTPAMLEDVLREAVRRSR